MPERAGLLSNVPARHHHAYGFFRVSEVNSDHATTEFQRVLGALTQQDLIKKGVGFECCTYDLLHPEGCPNRETTCTGVHLAEISEVHDLQTLARAFREIYTKQLEFATQLHASRPEDPTVLYPKKIPTFDGYRAYLLDWIAKCEQIAMRPVVARRPVVVSDENSPVFEAVQSCAPDMFIVKGDVIEDARTIQEAFRLAMKHFCEHYANDLTFVHCMQGLEVWKAMFECGTTTGMYHDFINFGGDLMQLEQQMMEVHDALLRELAAARRQEQDRRREAAAAAKAAATIADDEVVSECEERVIPDLTLEAVEEFCELEFQIALGGGPDTPDSPSLKPVEGIGRPCPDWN
jgi:hypothetical protein